MIHGGGMLQVRLPRGSPLRDFMSNSELTLVCKDLSPRVLSGPYSLTRTGENESEKTTAVFIQPIGYYKMNSKSGNPKC